jgi:SAM-dependent methyltransferase
VPDYSPRFYLDRQHGPTQSARQVVPAVIDLIEPKSVVDVGCGVGNWLAVFREHGVTDTLGLDGEWLDRSQLRVPPECFIGHDVSTPVRLDRTFDLVLSLEVAEHLPQFAAATYIDSLVRLGKVVLFSAAIPFQGGVHHLNEQWPDYWAGLFARRGYVPVDCLRKRIWDNPDVSWWYCQNLLVYVREDALDDYPFLAREYDGPSARPLAMVHPRRFLSSADPDCVPMSRLLELLATKAQRAVSRRLARLAGGAAAGKV